MDSLPLECPECGTRFPKGSRFCPHDGEALLEMGAKTLLFDGVERTEPAEAPLVSQTVPNPPPEGFEAERTAPRPNNAPRPESFHDQTPLDAHPEQFGEEHTREESSGDPWTMDTDVAPDAPRVPSRVPSFLPPPPGANKPKKDTLIGEVVGSYRIEALLGQGGMGRIYRASHTELGKLVAVKVLRADVAGEDEANARFIREARSTSALGHPNIVDVSDFGALPDGRSYFVMELLEGASLHQVIQNIGALEPRRALRMAERLASALQAAHSRGIVHRDLKPGNVFVCGDIHRSSEVKLLDFGIAKVTDATVRLTVAGAIFGTPQYMAPEQCVGAEVDHRADIYALGAMLFEMLTGSPPFDDPVPIEILFKQRSSPIPPLPPALAALEPLIQRVLAKDPNERFQSMRDFGVAIEDASDELAGPPRPSAPPAPSPSRFPPAAQSSSSPLSSPPPGHSPSPGPSPGPSAPSRPPPAHAAPVPAPHPPPPHAPAAPASVPPGPEQKRTVAFSYENAPPIAAAPAPYSNPPPPQAPAPQASMHSPALSAPPPAQAPPPRSRGRLLLLALGGLAVVAIGAGLAITFIEPQTDVSPHATPMVPAAIMIETTPPGAELHASDMLIGVTPCPVPRPSAPQEYQVSLAGHAAATFTLGPDSPATHSVALSPSP